MAHPLLLLVLSASLVASAQGYLNIFISHHEVMKLMGLEADLFYVHEGAINTYAMHFTVPVPADVHELEFSWQSLIPYPLRYTISIEYANDQDALGTPTLSIPHKGLVPQEIESFLVYLPCTGNASLQLPVNVNMVVQGPPRFNDTRLHFKRNKICAKGISPEPNQSPAPAHAPPRTLALMSAALCLAECWPCSLVPYSLMLCSMSTPKSSRGHGSGNLFGSLATGSTMTVASHGLSEKPKERLRRIPSVQPGALNYEQLIKEGTYGRIYAGKLGETCDALVKTVIDGASLTQVACLLSDASLLIGVSHQHILAPLLANTELPGPPEIAYPYPSKGNLKLYLQKSRESSTALSTRQLVEFGLHITKALAYLHSLGIVHKDLATRNCYLDEEAYVKICDSALSRDLFPDDYDCLGDNENRPLKWLSLESLQKRVYNTQGDVWSLGVLYWELVTLAQMPHEEVDIFELTNYLAAGYRLEQPVNCPDEFFTVMNCCWHCEPKQRPTPNQLLSYLQDFHVDLGMYI
ncbi:tyrosine-protein kinase Drl [Drosophila busckii]|uniref:tyrosine-protein kinase Drl n=1 Tax=Drosophila busckii TaxID=30019 RepID=UPI0014331016|nr:tyrosine-protein kinase Drl [Drosophila busckii]